MNFFNRIFRSNMVDCPRCLGKGNVDVEDIKRLKKELFWGPGKCAYCNGIGKVPPDRIDKISPGFEYLTTNLPSWERHKVINGDSGALQRASDHKEATEKLVAEMEHLFYIENKEAAEIAEWLFHKHGNYVYTEPEMQDTIAYIERVIESKRQK